MIAEITIDPTVLGSSIAAIICFAWGAYGSWRHSRTKEHRIAVDAERRVTDILQIENKALEERYNREHNEFLDTRKKYHDDRNEWTAKIGMLQEQVATLSAKTDVTAILEFQKQQTVINENLLQGSTQILLLLEKISRKMETDEKALHSHSI